MSEPTFNAAQGDADKEKGINRAVAARKAVFKLARAVAHNLAYSSLDKVTDMDEVHHMLWEKYKIAPHILGPAAGAVFRTDYVSTGRKKSARVSNHSAWIDRWKLKDEASVPPSLPTPESVSIPTE